MPKNDYLGTIFSYCPKILVILLKLGSCKVKKGQNLPFLDLKLQKIMISELFESIKIAFKVFLVIVRSGNTC